MNRSYIDISELIGKVFSGVENTGEAILFMQTDGSIYSLHHEQDCCEHVYIEDVSGDLSDLVGTPILSAEKSRSDLGPLSEYDKSFTWTFFHLRTIKGTVTIRFYGSSNGYYGESADLHQIQ